MKDLIIEDFPMSEIEFEKRNSNEQACMDYLAKMKWPHSRNIGKKFMRIVQQISSSTKTTYRQIVGGVSPYGLPAH